MTDNILNKNPKKGYGFIYKYTDPEGHSYIGQTTKSLSKRAGQLGIFYSNSYTKFANGIRKYGFNNFKVEILEECPIDLLDEKEAYYIEYFNTFVNGYNSTLGNFVREKTFIINGKEQIIERGSPFLIDAYCSYIELNLKENDYRIYEHTSKWGDALMGKIRGQHIKDIHKNNGYLIYRDDKIRGDYYWLAPNLDIINNKLVDIGWYPETIPISEKHMVHMVLLKEI